jgi:hypothetical protein
MDFSEYWRSNMLFAASQSTKELYNILYNFVESKSPMHAPLNELIKLDWLLYYNNGNMPGNLKRFDHSKVKNTLQHYIKSNDALVSSLLPNEDLDQKSLLKNIYYEVFYTDILNNPEVKEEYVVFFAKAINGEIHTLSKKLSDII